MTRALRVSLVTLGDPGRLTGGYLYHVRMAQAAPRHGARLEFVSFPDRPFPLAALDAPAVLTRARSLRTDVLVIDSICAAFAWPWFVAGRLRTPTVAMLHQPVGGIDHGAARTAVQARLDRFVYARVDRLLVASESLADALSADGMPHARIAVVAPGRDVTGFAEGEGGEAPLDLRAGRRVAFLCVANWLPRKGIDSLLDAFARLPAALATLHLAGDDHADPAYAARVHQRLATEKLADRVVVHGPVSLQRVALLYRSADAFVLPSLREPYGTVYGEAMAYGLPVVGWRVGNLRYLADDGIEGLLVEPGDVACLAAALQRLAEDEGSRIRLGSAARRRALARPTWEETARVFFDELRHASGAV